MSIFSKALSQIVAEDLKELLDAGATETIRLEFKRDPPKKEEIAKKLSSFANTYGGLLIVGAEADSSTGQLQALPGVEKQRNYKQTVIQWCADAIIPLIDVDVSPAIAMGSERFCYVISVRESRLTPHFLNGRKGLYVRSNEFSTLFEAKMANETELRHLLERRTVIEQRRTAIVDRSRKRFSTFVDSSYKKLTNNGIMGAWMDLSIGPTYVSQPFCDEQQLYEEVRGLTVPWRVAFPRDSQGMVCQRESVIVLRPGSSFSILEANVWGMLYYATELYKPDVKGLHLNHFVGQLLVFLKHAGLMLQKMGYDGAVAVQGSMHKIRRTPWVHFEGRRAENGPTSELDDDMEFELAADISDLADRLDETARDILQTIFFALNWPEMSRPAKASDAVRLGYEYNQWDSPKTP